MVMIIRMRPRTPGTMKFRLRSSGLYQTRTSGLTRTGFSPRPLGPLEPVEDDASGRTAPAIMVA